MAHPIRSGKDALPDHLSPDGDRIAAELSIRLHASGALSILGPIADPQWCLEVLAAATDYIRNAMLPREQIVIPEHDVELAPPPVRRTL